MRPHPLSLSSSIFLPIVLVCGHSRLCTARIAGILRAYQPRQLNVLQAIFRRHYAAFAESYPSRYACHYGRFRLARITKVSEAFIRCGDYRYGVARLQCSNPECRSEIFRPIVCF